MSQLRHLYNIEDAERYPKNFTAYDLLMQELNATGMSAEPEQEKNIWCLFDVFQSRFSIFFNMTNRYLKPVVDTET